MTAHVVSSEQLLPRPKRVRPVEGLFSLNKHIVVATAEPNDPILIEASRLLRRTIEPHHRASISHARSSTMSLLKSAATHPHQSENHRAVILLERTPNRRGDQWYALKIRPRMIRLRAGGPAGFRYGILSLGQLFSAGLAAIQAMDIEDWPDFPVRGVLLDISRDKIPTLSTLKRLIDRLAGWKINQVQLYMEHTFAYRGHEQVWRGTSPMTGSQIRELDRFCRRRCVELVPNQNSLSHMNRWLRHRRYAHLAECAGSWKTPWGETRSSPSMLNPLDPSSIRFMSSLYGQLLPHFSSGLFNVGCDEPWEIGQGNSRRACARRGADRVYFDYLLKVHRLVRQHDRRMMFWGDWIHQYPHLIPHLPADAIPLIWGYEADYSFDRSCARLKQHGHDFYVSPGTSSWCSFGGRTTNCRSNLHNAAISGMRHRATGYLINDWGDFGHPQYLPVSYGGFLYGSALAWCVRSNTDLDVAAELSRHVFSDLSGETGKLWLDAGRVHEDSGVILNNRTVLFSCMQSPLSDPTGVEGLVPHRAERMVDRVAEIKSRAKRARFGGDEGPLVKEELLATLDVLGHACRRAQGAVAMRVGSHSKDHRKIARLSPRRLAADMRRIIDRHRALWLRRNRRGGLADSLAYYRRILNEYVKMGK